MTESGVRLGRSRPALRRTDPTALKARSGGLRSSESRQVYSTAVTVPPSGCPPSRGPASRGPASRGPASRGHHDDGAAGSAPGLMLVQRLAGVGHLDAAADHWADLSRGGEAEQVGVDLVG